MFEIKSLTKAYVKGVNAVDDLSLTVNDGEIYGFIGHNGAGRQRRLSVLQRFWILTKGRYLLTGNR